MSDTDGHTYNNINHDQMARKRAKEWPGSEKLFLNPLNHLIKSL